MAYATPENCKDFSPIVSSAGKTDPQLVALIVRADFIIDAFTKQTFEKETKTLRVTGSGSRMLILPERLAVLTKLTFLDLDEGGTVVLSSEEVKDVFNKFWYLIAEANFSTPRTRPRFGVFLKREDNIEIEGDWGYSTVPAEVKNSSCLMVEKTIVEENSKKSKSSTFKEEDIGDYSYKKFDKSETASEEVSRFIPTEAKLLLRNFHKPLLPSVP